MILLDTHALIWLDQGSSRLGSRARQTANEALSDNGLAVSAVSFWEAAVLIQRGRIELDNSPDQWRKELLQAGLIEIPLDGRIAINAINLPNLHGDPADLFIIATAILNTARLITADRKMLSWPGKLDRFDARL